MKKLKVLLSVVLTCVLALSIAGCATNDTGDDGNGNGNEDVLTLALIEVDASNAKTEYFIGEEFTADGLVVTRSGRNETTGTSFFGQEVSLEDCSIDKSEFKSDTVGEYTITVSYTLGEITKSDDYTVKVVREVRPYRLVLDESGAQKSFSVGEEFTSDGLSVTAFDYNYKTQTELEPRDVTADIDVDASAYNKDVPGNYDIVVSYTQNETTINATYSVAVKLGAGLDIVLPEEAVVDASGALTVDLVKGGTSVDLTGWVVNQVDANGNVDEVVTEDITYSVYNGDTEVKLTSNSFTALQAGTYNVWATLEGYKIPGSDNTYTLKHFVLVYVMDSLRSITLNAEGSVLTQEAGSDVISDTWTFTATYSSGATKQLTAEDVEIEGLTTTAVTDNGVATVTYTEQNAKGETMSAETTVEYTITERQGEVSGYAGIGFDSMQTGTFTAAYAEATNGSLSISDANSILLGATVAHESTDKFSIIESAQSITTSAGNVDLAKAFVTEGASRINGSGVARRMIKIELGEGTYNIRVWASVKSASNTGRYVKAYNGPSGSTFDLSSEGTVVGNELTTAVQLCELTEVASGTWYIGGSASIVIHYIEVVAAAPQEQVYAIDFTDTTKIAANAQLAGTDITEAVPIKDIAGNDTGFSVTKSSSSSGKYNLIGEQNNMQVLQFQGSAKETQNSLVVNVAAGEVTVVVTYFSGNAGRYVKVVNEGLDTVVATDAELTTADKSVKTRTITFTLAEATNIYIGSASSGIYLCKVEITVK